MGLEQAITEKLDASTASLKASMSKSSAEMVALRSWANGKFEDVDWAQNKEYE